MIPEEHETLMLMCRLSLTGGECGHAESMAPLLCNTANSDYGKLVELRSDLFIVTHLAMVTAYETDASNDIQCQWTDEYDKTKVTCGNEHLHVYLHENYRNSSMESIEGIVLAWMKTQEEEL